MRHWDEVTQEPMKQPLRRARRGIRRKPRDYNRPVLLLQRCSVWDGVALVVYLRPLRSAAREARPQRLGRSVARRGLESPSLRADSA